MIQRFVVLYLLFASLSLAVEAATVRVLAINTTGTDLYYMTSKVLTRVWKLHHTVSVGISRLQWDLGRQSASFEKKWSKAKQSTRAWLQRLFDQSKIHIRHC